MFRNQGLRFGTITIARGLARGLDKRVALRQLRYEGLPCQEPTQLLGFKLLAVVNLKRSCTGRGVPQIPVVMQIRAIVGSGMLSRGKLYLRWDSTAIRHNGQVPPGAVTADLAEAARWPGVVDAVKGRPGWAAAVTVHELEEAGQALPSGPIW